MYRRPALRRGVPVLVLVLLWGGGAAAAPPEVLDDVVVEAHARGGDAAVAAVAAGRTAEPWQVVEKLLLRAAPDAARAWAAAQAPGALREALLAYVVWRLEHPLAAASAAAARGLAEDAAAGNLQRALQRFDAEALADQGVTGIVLRLQHAGVLERLKRPADEVEAAYRRAVVAADARGWGVAALQALDFGMRAAEAAGASDVVVEFGEEFLDRTDAERDRAIRWRAHLRMSRALLARGQTPVAIEHASAALAMSRSVKERRDALRRLLIANHATLTPPVLLEQHERLRALEVQLADAHGVAACDVRIAGIEVTMGHWTAGLARLERALEFLEREGSPGERRGAHKNAALVALEMLDLERAGGHLERARALATAQGDVDIDLLVLEALLHCQAGRPAQAQEIMARALGHAQALPAATRQGLWSRLASVQALARDPQAAQRSLEAARAEAGGETDAMPSLVLLMTETHVQLQLGQHERAVAAAARARALGERLQANQHLGLLDAWLAQSWLTRGEPEQAMEAIERAIVRVLQRSAALPERVGWQYRSQLPATFALAVEAAARAKDLPRLFAFAERARAVALRNRLAEGAASLDAWDAERGQAEATLQAEETDAVTQLRQASDAEAMRAAFARLGAVRERLDRHRDRMHAENAAAAQVVDPQVPALDVVQAGLGPDEVQVHLAQGLERMLALVVAGGDVRLVDLGAEEALDEAIEGLVLEDPTGSSAKAEDLLRERLVTPLAIPATARRLTIVPSGRLAIVPYALLWPEHEVRLLPSATIGHLLARRKGAAGVGVLAVGDPGHPGAQPLPGAAAEAEAVGDVTLVGDAATEGGVREALATRARWRAVHVACHGRIDPLHPLRSSLALAPSAGADGLWTVGEILGSRVPADLVVLAACSSGQARTFEQEGRAGFVHAFFVAGASEVIVSLWDLDDAAMRVFMEHLHGALRAGTPTATALQRSQAWMRAQPAWKHPAYWAGWQLWGQGAR